jgi:hypothetical protein
MVGTSRVKATRPPDRSNWQVAATRPGLLDAGIVRAELARLRAPRAQTKLYRTRARRSTVPGER